MREGSETTMTRVMLAPNAVEDIDNEDRVKLLSIIDQFRELGVNEDVSLPQVRQISGQVLLTQ